jgi:hypothetical protein
MNPATRISQPPISAMISVIMKGCSRRTGSQILVQVLQGCGGHLEQSSSSTGGHWARRTLQR